MSAALGCPFNRGHARRFHKCAITEPATDRAWIAVAREG
jgi:hypothetical protein